MPRRCRSRSRVTTLRQSAHRRDRAWRLTPTMSMCSRAQRNIEIGRVALCNLKADKRYGKLLVIVDIIDQNRVRVMVERRATAG
jgi:hypothetical protein